MLTREDRIVTLAAANKARCQRKRDAVEVVLGSFRSRREAVTVSGVARQAQVSRNFLYSQADLLEQIRAAAAERSDRMLRARPRTSTDDSLRRRLANALDAIKEKNRVIADQRATIERLTGELARQMASGTSA